jgi:hypothetical protein
LCGGASGDEGRNYIRGESTIGFRELQCCINPALRPLTLFVIGVKNGSKKIMGKKNTATFGYIMAYSL